MIGVSYAIVFVSDMTASLLFYRDVVGLTVKFSSPEWTEFVADANQSAPSFRQTTGPIRLIPRCYLIRS